MVAWAGALQPLLERMLAVHRLPGLALAVAYGAGEVEQLALGTDAAGRPLGPDTVYPIASAGKLAVALAVLRLADAGALALDDPLARHLPDAVGARAGVTLRRLLCHTSGLPFLFDTAATPYTAALDWPAMAGACLRTPLAEPPGTRVVYSEVGPILLAVVVERLTDRPLPAALDALVCGPLEVEAYLGAEPPRPPASIAGVGGPHAGTPLEPYNSPAHRRLANPADSMLATTGGTLRLVRAFLGRGGAFLREGTRAEAVRDQTGGLGGGIIGHLEWPRCPWGLGPELRGAKAPHWVSPEASPHSFGHAGASGCLAWADPDVELAWVLQGTRHLAGGWLLETGPALTAALLATAR